MGTKEVKFTVHGGDRLFHDLDHNCQIFVLERKDLVQALVELAPLGYRQGETIRGLKKKDTAANQQEIVAEITTTTDTPDKETLETFRAQVGEFAKKADEMEFITIHYPLVGTLVFLILVERI